MALLRNTARSSTSPSATGLSPSLAPHPRGLRVASLDPSAGPTTPIPQGDRFGLRPVRSPLLGASRLISLPPGTEMFQFPGFALHIGVTGVPTGRVSPFGHPGLTACVRLPPAYRSLPRPSSPPCAQASPTGLQSLDYTNSQALRAVDPLLGVLQISTSDRQPTARAADRQFTMLDSDSIITSTSFVKQHEPRRARLRAEKLNAKRSRGVRVCDFR